MSKATRARKRPKAISGKRKMASGRYSARDSVYRIGEEHLADLGQEMEALGKLLSPSGETDVNRFRAITSRLATDPRYVAIKAAFREVEALVRAGDSLGALELKIDVVNGIWERSQEREVARDAFFRRIRGKDFKPISYLDPMTSDRGAALARILQADKEAVEALVGEPARPKEFVIELTGDYDIVRVIRD